MIIKSKRHPDRQKRPFSIIPSAIWDEVVNAPIQPPISTNFVPLPVVPAMFTGVKGTVTMDDAFYYAPYNPFLIQEDFVTPAVTAGRGSKVEKLPGGNIWDDYTYTDDFMSFFSRKQILQLYGLIEPDQELEDHLKTIGL